MAATGARVKVKVKAKAKALPEAADVAGKEPRGSTRGRWVHRAWQKERAATEHAMARTNVDIKLLAVAKSRRGAP